MPLTRLSRDDYRVGWICPLEVEQIAAMEMLDEEHETLSQPRNDTNIYNLGTINSHHIVIAGLPSPGNCSAATVITQMKITFPKLEYSLLVGIGGGVPVKTDQGMIRLGHVVVSEPTETHSGVVQYDYGKARAGGFERKGYLGRPPPALLNAAREVAVRRRRSDHDPVWDNMQRIPTHRQPLRHFKFPGTENDRLYRPDYMHQQNGVSCDEGRCDPEQRIKRVVHDDDAFVVVHRGTIASGELVIKDAKRRDDLSREHGVLCFEMEAAGVLTGFPSLVIRGISDYCDSHKNDQWHGFAAAAAAAYARQIVSHIPTEETQRIIKSQAKTRALLDFYRGEISVNSTKRQPLLPAQVLLQPVYVVDSRNCLLPFHLETVNSKDIFVEILKLRFSDLGTTKIERGEWLLENWATGRSLDLSKPWQSLIKPGQYLRMRMIFRQTKSSMMWCPSCAFMNSGRALGEQIRCQRCGLNYKQAEEVRSFQMDRRETSTQNSVPNTSRDDSPVTLLSSPKLRATQSQAHDIFRHRHVQIVHVEFLMPSSVHSTSSAPVIRLNLGNSLDQGNLATDIAKMCGLTEAECRAVAKAVVTHFTTGNNTECAEEDGRRFWQKEPMRSIGKMLLNRSLGLTNEEVEKVFTAGN